MNKYSEFGNKAGKVRMINTVIAVVAVIVIGGAGFMAVKTAKPKFEDFKEQMAEKKAEREEAKKKAEAEKAAEEKKAEEEKKAAAEGESQTETADTSEENVPAEPATLYSAWSERLASAEQEDAQILASKPSDGEFYGSMAAEQSRYDLWDGLLNEMWQDLKGTLGSGEMEALTNEQVDWIHQKEAMVADYWNSQSVDYSAFPNAPAAETTKTRVYYLLEKCPG